MLSLLAIAIAPCLVVMGYIYFKDKFEKEPKKLLLHSFFGGIGSIFIAVTLQTIAEKAGLGVGTNYISVAILAFVVVALSEELSKYLFVRLIPYKNKAFNEPFDGIVYSVFVSMGFAMLENVLYVMQHGMGTGVMRMFTAIPAHATFGIIMGYYIGKAKFDKANSVKYHIYGILGAVLFHGLYDFSLMQNEIKGLKLIGALASLYVAIRLSKKAIKMHHDVSPFNGNIGPLKR